MAIALGACLVGLVAGVLWERRRGEGLLRSLTEADQGELQPSPKRVLGFSEGGCCT